MTKKIAFLVTDEFNDKELQVPYERLKDAGFKVLIVGPVADKEVKGEHGHFSITANLAVDSVKPDDFDALVIPGGHSPERLRLNPASVNFVREFYKTGRPVAAICHAAQLLISAGIVSGRTLTCWPPLAIDVTNAGGNFVDRAIVVDHNLITSRKPDDLPVFVDAIIASLEEEEDQLSA